jgi:hypothetical protein
VGLLRPPEGLPRPPESAPALRIFRLFRILRAFRIVRSLGGPRVFRELRQELASGALYLVIFVGILVLELCVLLELFSRRTRSARTSRPRATRSGGAT